MWNCHKMITEGNMIYEENVLKNYVGEEKERISK